MKFTEFQRIRNLSKERNNNIEYKKALKDLKIPHFTEDNRNIVQKLYGKKKAK